MSFSEKDSELAAQANNFAAVLSSNPALYGQLESTAAAVSAAVTAYVNSFRELSEARANGVRSEQQTATRTTNRQLMFDLLRPIYLAVQASKSISDADKLALGVHVKAERRSRRPVPPVPPELVVTKVNGSVVSLRFYDPQLENGTAQPEFADGIAVFAHAGDERPSSLTGYKFVANTGQMKIDVTFGPEAPMGSTIWFVAAFFNSRKQLGPVCAPVQATIGAGSTIQMMKMAG